MIGVRRPAQKRRKGKGLLIAVGVLVALFFLLPVLGASMLLMVIPTTTTTVLAQCSGSSTSYAPVSGDVRIPMTSDYEVGSGFGMRFHPIYHYTRMHNGVDISLRPSYGPIVAAMGGTITRASDNGQAGLNVDIDHGNGVETRYMHLSRIDVTVGQRVTAGQQLGLEGSTGASTAPHLHWSVRVNGAYVDPVAWASQHGIKVNGKLADGLPAASSTGSSSSSSLPTADTLAAPTSPVAGYSGEQLTNAAAVIKAGRDLGLDDWTITVGVMTAMGESSLKNLDRGDAVGPDSRGLFQQRDNGAWGSYADRMNPYTAATNFFRALTQVKDYRTLQPTIAAHKTQINADPWHYETYWDSATAVVAALTNNPGLASSLANYGTGCDSTLSAQAGIGVPGLSTNCAPTGLPAESGLQSTALNYLRCTATAFPSTFTYGGYRASAIDKQGHPAGLAIDVMVPNYHSSDGIAKGQQAAQWTIDNYQALNVKYLIWRQQQWTPSGGWKSMADRGSDTQNHMDHVHVTLNPPNS